MQSTNLRKLETWPSSTQQGASRSFDATTTSTYARGTSTWATSSYTNGKATKDATS
jgi:hypothetical protein